MNRRDFLTLAAAAASGAASPLSAPADEFRFGILGDRTGEAAAGVYEQVWNEMAAEHPAFVISVGDTIQGGGEAKAVAEWREVDRILAPYRAIPLYLAPGNHDIWSPASERLFRERTARPLHYGYDFGSAHFTVLDNSRSEDLSATELAFLESDLKAHAAQPLKLVVMHRPSWVIPVALRNPDFPLHQLARRYGVRYVIAGHIHQMLRFELEGVTYISMPSAGGQLRAGEEYEKGWFFGHALAQVKRKDLSAFEIHEARPPHGRGRTTSLSDWGMLGLEPRGQRAAGGSRSAGMPAR
ncbi:MAG: metallophosphoesterase [Acidobacteriia bacterium]|nr:metallophosphoesterase [Terriglobia bacterium]